MDVGIIIGEATSLTWDRWRHVCHLVERLGYHSLFRSDHYFNGSQKDALDVFLSFVLAAEVTDRVRFGPLVSPVTFRQPVNVGRMAQQLDALSDGRFVLGLGAGWHEEEHRVYGIDFPPRSVRYERLREAIELMMELWYSESGSYRGTHYRLDGTDSKPHPPRGQPPLLLGGIGPTRTLPMVAEHAAEWNATPLGPDRYRASCDVLARHCEAIGRDPGEIRRSMLIWAVIGPGPDIRQRSLDRYLAMIGAEGAAMTMAGAEAAGMAPWQGSVEQLVDHVGQLRALGLDEIIFEHFCHEDDTMPEWLAAEVKPKLDAL